MEDEIKMLMGFVVESEPEILISPCEESELIEIMKSKGKVTCTSKSCEKKENCLVLNPELPFLPLDRFHVWIVNAEKIGLSEGYVFHLASNTLKTMGVLAVMKGNFDENVARGYGFQILYHGSWDYYLKASDKRSNMMDLIE